MPDIISKILSNPVQSIMFWQDMKYSGCLIHIFPTQGWQAFWFRWLYSSFETCPEILKFSPLEGPYVWRRSSRPPWVLTQEHLLCKHHGKRAGVVNADAGVVSRWLITAICYLSCSRRCQQTQHIFKHKSGNTKMPSPAAKYISKQHMAPSHCYHQTRGQIDAGLGIFWTAKWLYLVFCSRVY